MDIYETIHVILIKTEIYINHNEKYNASLSLNVTKIQDYNKNVNIN